MTSEGVYRMLKWWPSKEKGEKIKCNTMDQGALDTYLYPLESSVFGNSKDNGRPAVVVA